MNNGIHRNVIDSSDSNEWAMNYLVEDVEINAIKLELAISKLQTFESAYYKGEDES